ncbi:hypothetical protein EXIGLDRAFT_640750 [Exidia glandulosa HHB12029]|uniref:Spindle pole body component n=1 Tax=Exidia glandulosa HHB12029 TaxID=1314781 RepID=A0A165MHT9_EXIGL|nr:hypothetical protein EXIGLDRAFT_640750 [Exidia glandulosa HHB12029]
MLAELLLILAGHPSSLFVDDGRSVTPALAELLHPGERDVLLSIGSIASRYRRVRQSCAALSSRSSRYVAALCRTLSDLLENEYDALIVDVEARVLQRDSSMVASGSFVPLSTVMATFSKWSAPLATLNTLFDALEKDTAPATNPLWYPGPLLDLLLERAQTGVHLTASIYVRLADSVQRVWKAQLACFVIHGLPEQFADPEKHLPYPTSIPSCVSEDAADSIAYVGRAIAVVKRQTAQWRQRLELPRDLTVEHARLLDIVMPAQRHDFDAVIAKIRENVSEWLWKNVLTRKDVDETINSLSDYFLLRNGEFTVAFIREIESLKHSRLTRGTTKMIREQDLQLAILRASLGTSAQHDPTLTRLRLLLPSGPHRPLLPTLSAPILPNLANILSANRSTSFSKAFAPTTTFNDLVLGTPMDMSYILPFPLDLFLQPSDLRIYSHIFAFLSSLRRVHMRVFDCWSSLSNAQRARRRWTGLGEGGDESEGRGAALRAGWGVVRKMTWFLDTLFGYIMPDVIDEEYHVLKTHLWSTDSATMGLTASASVSHAMFRDSHQKTNSVSSSSGISAPHIDFTTLRGLHSTFLERVVAGCLLSTPALSALLRSICEVCERFVGQVERWGGDVLPPLLAEGSVAAGRQTVGELVRERFTVVQEVNETLSTLLESFYDHLSTTTSQPLTSGATADASMLLNPSTTAGISFAAQGMRGKSDATVADSERAGQMIRRLERLLLRLDFNGSFSAPTAPAPVLVMEDAGLLSVVGL